MKRNAKLMLSWALRILGAYMIYDGSVIYFRTSGYVQGSEFGMLITLANEFALALIWLALFTFWKMAPEPEATGS